MNVKIVEPPVTTQGNVITFPVTEKPKLYLVCAQCECMSFCITQEGPECTACERLVTTWNEDENFHWRKEFPAAENDPKDIGGAVKTIRSSSEKFAKARVLRTLKQWEASDDLAAVFVYNMNGATSSWANVSDDEDRNWMLEKLYGLVAHLKNWKF